MATYLPTALTLGGAISRVARVVRGQDSTEIKTEAKEAIQDTLRAWMREHDWNYLLTEAPAITASANVSDYLLPANFRKVYTVRITKSPYTLTPMEGRLRDRLRPSFMSGSTPSYYSLVQIGQQRKIRVIPAFAAADDFIYLTYHRALTIPTATAQVLDVPDHWIDGIVAMGAGRLLMERSGQDGRRDYFVQLGRQALETSKQDDLREADDDPFLIPQVAWASHGYPPNSDWAWVQAYYGY